MKISERLQILIDEKKWNQTRLADEIGKKKNVVNRWFIEASNPSPFSLKKISEATGCRLEWLRDGEGEMFSGTTTIGISGKTSSGKQITATLVTPYGDATDEQEREHCIQEMNSLFQIIMKWQEDENGLDSLTSMNFVREFHARFPELGDWLKKQKGCCDPATPQESLSDGTTGK